MKYLKTYEKIFDEKDFDLGVGDYLLVTTTDNRLTNVVVIVTEIPCEKYYVIAEIPDYFGDYGIYYSEIIKKLSDAEVELYKNMKKYNI